MAQVRTMTQAKFEDWPRDASPDHSFVIFDGVEEIPVVCGGTPEARDLIVRLLRAGASHQWHVSVSGQAISFATIGHQHLAFTAQYELTGCAAQVKEVLSSPLPEDEVLSGEKSKPK